MLEPLKQFRKRINDDEILFGPSLTLADPEISAILAPSSDFMWYDLEHGGISEETLRAHMHISHGLGRMCMVRLPDGSTRSIKPVLDSGADSIIVPQIRSADEVRRVVAECRYPPQGTRGFGPRVGADFGRINACEYAKEANKNIFIWVMIEHCDAVEAIDNIVATEGLDGIIIGPMDLSASYGVLGQTDQLTVDNAIKHTIEAASRAGKTVGVGWETRLEGLKEQFLDRGAQLIQVGCDFMYLTYFWERVVRSYREKIADFRV